jgi:hypothetical protein
MQLRVHVPGLPSLRKRRLVLLCWLTLAIAFIRLWPSALRHVATRAVPPFKLGETVGTLGETSETVRAEQHPLSASRPQNQFSGNPLRPITDAPIALITVPSSGSSMYRLRQTHRSLNQSSLQSWRWIILTPSFQDDFLAALELDDKRVAVLQYDGPELSAYDQALEAATSYNASVASFLAEGSLLEPTWLEKAVWSLHSVPTWHMVAGFDVMVDAEDPARLEVQQLGLLMGERYLEASVQARAVHGLTPSSRST